MQGLPSGARQSSAVLEGRGSAPAPAEVNTPSSRWKEDLLLVTFSAAERMPLPPSAQLGLFSQTSPSRPKEGRVS